MLVIEFPESMDNHEEYIVTIFTQRYPPVFDSTVVFIINRQGYWIKENFSGTLKTYLVFPKIFPCLDRIPFKIVLHSFLLCNTLSIYNSFLIDAKGF